MLFSSLLLPIGVVMALINLQRYYDRQCLTLGAAYVQNLLDNRSFTPPVFDTKKVCYGSEATCNVIMKKGSEKLSLPFDTVSSYLL